MSRGQCLAFLALGFILGAGGNLDDNPCDRDLLVTAHRRIETAVGRLAEVHSNFTGGRHYEVIEVVSVFQVDMLARSALRFIESLRLAFCALVCPMRFETHWSPGVDALDAGVLVEQLGLSRHMREYFQDVRYVASRGGQHPAEVLRMWDGPENELEQFSRRIETFVEVVRSHSGQRLKVEMYSTFEPLLLRVLQMVVDFVSSLAADTGTLFNAPNYVSDEMLPPGEGDAIRPGTVDIFVSAQQGTAFHPGFMHMLRDSDTILTQPAVSPRFRECGRLPPAPSARRALPEEFADTPAVWAHTDVSGIRDRRGFASPVQLLRAAARTTRLSNLFISLQVSSYLLTPTPACGSRLVLYDPSLCLMGMQWGGYFFHLNPLPPFNLTVTYAGKPLGRGTEMSPLDIHSVHVPSMDTQWSALVSTFKSMNHHSPDMLFVSPFIGNCQVVDRLLGSGSIHPKIIYLPINPLEPPPSDTAPDFLAWWSDHGEVLLAQLLGGITASAEGPAGMPVTTSVWQAQCSLVAGARRMRRHGYVLLHIEHTYAVFFWRPLFVELFGEPRELGANDADGSGLEPLHTAWLRGWHCSPHSRYLFDLEIMVGGPADAGGLFGSDGFSHDVPNGVRGEDRNSGSAWGRRDQLLESAASIVPEVPTLRYFLERRTDADRLGRGRCAEGICECLPPYRGDLCEGEDPPRVPQRLRAAIHYTTAETERDLLDLKRSLRTLWARYNRRYDYPVVVFHEGLSLAARRRIVGASENRLWFATLPRFKDVPPEWAVGAEEFARDFSVGYRAMIRWRSGPMFLEPALASFDYAMTLDTDSYFPADMPVDPFELLHREGWVAGFPHLGRESASVVVNFMHHFLLYCRLKGLHPRRTKMLEALIEKNFKWYQQCLMLDMEVVRLDWFRGETYQDFFRYMDASGGFWLHRWGNNPVRTFAVGLLLEDSQVRALTLPYAHQDYCSCGQGAPPCRADASSGIFVCDGMADGGLGIGVGDLSEGLLDLQPWRGTERQKKAFHPSVVQDFVREQMLG